MNSEKSVHANHRQRFIDKFLKNPSSFAEHELLEILLYSVIARKDTNELAHKLLSYFGSLEKVFTADPSALMNVSGVGKRVASHIKTIGLIYEHMPKNKSEQKVTCTSFGAIKTKLDEAFYDATSEKFLLMFFDKGYKLLSSIEYTNNQFHTVMISGAQIVEAINIIKPSYAIIAHNHLTDNPAPSSHDDVATTKLNILLDLHNVFLNDHVIVAKNKTYSYYHSGRLQTIKEKCTIDKMISHLKSSDGELL